MNEKKDYLAIIFIATGSSHARGPDLEDCVERVQRIFVSDWRSLFDVAGKPAKVAVYDVTGFDRIYWDGQGVHSEDARRKSVDIPLLEVRDVILPLIRS